MNKTIEELTRMIEFKKEIIAMTEEEIRELEKRKALAEVEQDEKPGHVWDLTDPGKLKGGENVQG